MAFHAYLFFSGTCREAFTRYQEVFGGELFLMPMSEVPDGTEMPPGSADMIIHAALTLPDGAMLMASDDPTGDHGPVKGISVSYTSKDAGETKRIFDALAEGGEVTQEPTETFFSPMFGMCVDKFGVPWMVNTEAPEQAAGG
jgi:PhnB protein